MIEYSELKQAIEALPPSARKELMDFIGYLQYKHRLVPPGEVVKLGGLWAGIDFHVTDDDVRALRQRVTRQLADKA
ncbi:MAG: DUF2281 domain-containing protein [Anaerolineae bacterium]|nr:DUF2281 domain-containing protein [Anaerolineae bacterium]